MKLPWVKWYPTDWISDAELRKTSLLGRGLWIDALNAMLHSDTYALSGTPEELSRLLSCDVAEFNTALDALKCHKAACVTERNNVVTLVSRRLEREHNARKNGALRVAKHREKQRCNTKVPSASVSASDSASEGLRVQRERERRFTKPTWPEMDLHAQKIGLPPTEIDKFFAYYESNGWRVGKNPMRSWQYAMVNWRNNYNERRYQASTRAPGCGSQENPRNAGIVRGPTDYGEAYKRKQERQRATSEGLAGQVDTHENHPPTGL